MEFDSKQTKGKANQPELVKLKDTEKWMGEQKGMSGKWRLVRI